MKTDKILIAADDSSAGIKAIRYGFNLARELGAKVMLLHVIDPVHASGNPDAGIFPDDALITIKTAAEDFMDRMQKEYGNNLDTELILPQGDVQNAIIDTALNWGAGLIVTGTHGRTGLDKLFNGSMAESIIHHSPVPVLVVPTEK
jgi:nucleotide-binding universal stress UspA family protein